MLRLVNFTTWLRSPTGIAVNALGITQIISWGTTLYALAVLGGPIALDTGWDRSIVFGGLTLGLLISGVISSWCGSMIDHRGARGVMAIGSVLNSFGLFALAWAPDKWSYLGAWALLGISMRFTLYDAAFAALVQVAPANGRRAIAFLTLWGGFASTVFWPVGAALEAWLGWRGTCAVFALLNLAACTPLHWWGLARREPPSISRATPDQPPAPIESAILEGRDRLVAMSLFAVSTSAYAFIFGAASAHLVALIEASGVAAATAVAIAASKGIAQVAGRLWEIVFARQMPAIRLARIPVWLMPAAFVILIALAGGPLPALIFTLAFGAANGLITIVRGALPLALFGREGYGKILGVLATPYLIINALAPLVFSVVVERWGYLVGQWLLFSFALASLIAMEIMTAWYERRSMR